MECRYILAGLLALSICGLACQSGSDLVPAQPPPAPPAPPSSAPDAGMTSSHPDATAQSVDADEPPADPDAGEPPPSDAGVAPAHDAGAYEPIGPRCFSAIFDPNTNGPNYDQFQPVVGSHCLGTNHQNISGIEKVVFLGDSITQGTPPTPISERYRIALGHMLEDHFGPLEIANCAAWGARTDDLLMPPHQQIHECFPDVEPLRTLVIMTIGGNDIASVTKDGAAGAPITETRPAVEQFVHYLRDAVHWLKDDPTRFPNGVYLVFANMYEFTDATGDVTSCPGAALAGFDAPWPDAEELVVWANEQYMQIAVETGTDMIFMLEHFCGHGYHNDDPSGRCYRGPDTERWFDLTCIHPNPAGHAQIADMFMNVVLE